MIEAVTELWIPLSESLIGFLAGYGVGVVVCKCHLYPFNRKNDEDG